MKYNFIFQAVLRQAIKKGAAKKKNKKDAPEQHRDLLKIIALAYLPPGKILPTYKLLKEDIKFKFKNFGNFFKYFETEWLGTVTPIGFSVHGLRHITNNFLETYHRNLNRDIGKKPYLSFFMSTFFIYIFQSRFYRHAKP